GCHCAATVGSVLSCGSVRSPVCAAVGLANGAVYVPLSTSRSWFDSRTIALPLTTWMCCAVLVCGHPFFQMSESTSEFTYTLPCTCRSFEFCTCTMPSSSRVLTQFGYVLPPPPGAAPR